MCIPTNTPLETLYINFKPVFVVTGNNCLSPEEGEKKSRKSEVALIASNRNFTFNLYVDHLVIC